MYSRRLVTEDQTLSLPRIMCLHGGGTNAKIFQAQCRGLMAQLKSEFRFVFAEAPFASQAGPDVMSVYSEWGPFKRWLRWRPDHPRVSHEDIVRELDQCLEDAKSQDDRLGATGEWVALLGFSQGAKLCASLLYRQQTRAKAYGKHVNNPSYRFGVLLAGRAPLVSLDTSLTLYPPLPDASQITDVQWHHKQTLYNQGHILRIPTIHVHGMRDQGLELHQQLFTEFCARDRRRLVEWEGNHRVPLKLHDVMLVAGAIRELAKETGI